MTDRTDYRAERDVDTRRAEVTAATPSEDVRTVLLNKVSWGAIFAGVVIALVVQFLLSLLGIGVGASTLNPGTSDNPDASTFSLIGAIWYAVTGIIASFAGGFIASRLSGRPLASSGALHGLTTWAVTTLVVLYLLTTAIGGLIGGALGGITSLAGGLGSTVATVAQTAAPALAQTADPFSAIQSQISQATGGTDPRALQDAAVAAVRAAVTGDQAAADQATETAAQALARSQNIPIEQARTQVTQYRQQYQDAVAAAQQQAVRAADAAASATSIGSIVAFVALLLGAIAAWIGGRMGVAAPIVTGGERSGGSRY
jgi:hypothetical protein